MWYIQCRVKLKCGYKIRSGNINFTFMLPCIAIDFFLNNQLDARRTNYPNLCCYKTLHVSGIFSAQYQGVSTVHSALVSFMQVFDDRFQAESGFPSWSCLEAVIKNLHETYQCRMYSRKLLMTDREAARNM